MTTSTENNDTGGSSGFTPSEDAYFASGGESALEGGEGGAAPDAGAADGSASDGAAPADGAAAPAPKGDQNVPLARFLEEKKARKGLETQIAELRGKFSIIERLGAPDPAAAAAPVVPPTAEEDIFGNVKHVGETVAQLQKRLDDADAATKAQGEQSAFVNNYKADAETFKAKSPDYMDAYNFVLQARANELLSIGYDNPSDPTLTPDEAHAARKALHDALTADEYAIAEMAFAKKKSPAEMLYNLAKQRGYKPAAAAGAEGEGGKGAETLDRIERGQAANKSLTTPGGATGDAGMTAERLLAMPLDQFEAWADKNPAAAKRIMGG